MPRSKITAVRLTYTLLEPCFGRSLCQLSVDLHVLEYLCYSDSWRDSNPQG